jgi:16S rRNA (adenine(1408)-N(1))-methyltransferase
MEYIYGKKTARMDGTTLAARLGGYAEIGLDLGTGDGRYVEQVARQNPKQFLIGIDACRENLVKVSNRAAGNTLFLIANAEALPAELSSLADFITLNFPWGSLLTGLLETESRLIANLRMVAKAGARLELRLNESAIRQAGWSLDRACGQVVMNLEKAGFALNPACRLALADLRRFPSSWARRLGSGQEGQTLFLSGGYREQRVGEIADRKSA